MTQTNEIARRYYRLVNAQDMDNLLALFSDEICFDLPDGRKVEGKAALQEMYSDVFARGGPQPQPVRVIAGEAGAAAEVEVTLSDGRVLQMASFFHTNESGLVERVGVYRRG